VSAGLGAILTTINAAHRMNQAAAAANAYLEVQTAARQTRVVDLPYQSIEEARATLAELAARPEDVRGVPLVRVRRFRPDAVRDRFRLRGTAPAACNGATGSNAAVNCP
jgi:hypothetical protein